MRLRELIDIIEGKKPPRDTSPWGVEMSEIFQSSMDKAKLRYSDIYDHLDRFLILKTPDPVSGPRFGNNDGPFTGPLLSGFLHCHLREDAVLIYRLRDRKIFLIKVVSHSETEGRKQKILSKELSPYK